MKEQSHIIRKQSLKVNASVHDAFALKRKVEDILQSLMPKLNYLFDELTSENEWLQIDTLDINIGDVSESEMEEVLSKKILQSMREKIIARMHDMRMIGGYEREPRALLITADQKTMAAFIYFLDNGILPWWFEPGSHSAFEQQLLEAMGNFVANNHKVHTMSFTAGDGSEKKIKLFAQLQLVLNNLSARKRLIEQFSEEVFLSVITWFSYEIHLSVYPEIGNSFQGLKRFFSGYAEDGLRDKMIKEMKVLLLEKIIHPGRPSDDIITEWMSALLKTITRQGGNVKMIKILETAIAHRYLRNEINELTTHPIPGEISPVSENEILQNQATEKTTEEHLKELNATDGAIIANAGLIILAPFLPELFRQCGILKEDEITDINKAIAIMHYAVFGDCNYREYDVLLNKILCGIDEYYTIEVLDTLSETETNEIELMISSVIEYWTSLKNTSAEGLREGFLIRKGKLTPKYDEWFLQVEQYSIDILLQSLPWTISLIKLPWMKKSVHTEWV
jgi:hypothetical protein